jgi:hypothetical protein
MTYPDGIDALVNVNANDSLAAGGHAARHNSVNTALVEVKDYLVGAFGSKLDVAGGKILQIVRATDTTNRVTTSTSVTDVTGMSVTITPQKNNSAVLLIASFRWTAESTTDVNNYAGELIVTDASNNPISGAENGISGVFNFARESTGSTRQALGLIQMIGYSTPETTSAVTYKLRFAAPNANVTITIANAGITGQMYAIEVSA